MKKQMDWHKYGSFALLIGFVISMLSGGRKNKKFHAAGALLVGLGMTACIYSGHRLIGEDTFMNRNETYFS